MRAERGSPFTITLINSLIFFEKHRAEICDGVLPVDILHIRRRGKARHVEAIRLERSHCQIRMAARLIGALGADLANAASARAEVQYLFDSRLAENGAERYAQLQSRTAQASWLPEFCFPVCESACEI